MDEEELLAKLLEEQFVAEPEPPTPPVEDDFFNVDSITGNVGIGTSIPFNARVHIISRDPYPAVRILQKGTGDVLLIDNKDIADPNDPPSTPYFNIKNDGRVGVGTTLPLAEFHLVTEKEGDILIGGVIGTGPLVSPTDSGIFFSGLGNTVSSGLFTEVDGLVVDLAVNVEQVGTVDTSRVGGIVRLDTRREGEYSSELGDYNSLTVKGFPIGMGTTGEYNVLTANLDTSDIHISPVKGEVYVGAYSSVTSVGIGTYAIDEQYRLYVNGNTGIAGTLSLPDYSKITLGIASRLELYYDPISQSSYLIESDPTGDLVIAGNNIEFKNSSLTETHAFFQTDGTVKLYYDNIPALETTLTGIFVGNKGISATATISGPSEIVIDPEILNDNSGIVRIKGDLYVDGSTTQIYSTVVTIADIRVGIASTVSTNNVLLQDAGIEIGIGTIQKKLTYNFNSDALKSTENFDLAVDKVYKIDGNSVLSISTVGTSVTTSYLQKVGILIDLTVAGLTSTQDLYVVGFATIGNANIDQATFGSASIGYASITAAKIGFSTIGYSTITSTDVGIATIGTGIVGYSTITAASIGFSTISNLIVGTGSPNVSRPGILTVGAISPVAPLGVPRPNIGDADQVLTATGSAEFNNTGIGLTWKTLTFSGGGGAGAAIPINTVNSTDARIFKIIEFPSSELTGGVGIASTLFAANSLQYNESTKVLSDVNGNFRAIPPSGNTITVDSTDVGKSVITTQSTEIQNGQFFVGDAVTIVNRNNSTITLSITLGGSLIIGGTTTSLTSLTLSRNAIVTILCVQRAGNSDNTFIVSGAGI